MKEGDLVKWIGFPGASVPPERTGPLALGIIICIRRYLRSWDVDGDYEPRYEVAWGDGTIGTNLYEQTIEVVNGNG